MTTTAAAKPRHRVYAYETDKAAQAVATDSGRMEAFTFGDPEPVTSMRDVWYEGVWLTPDEWYEPPIPLSILAKSYRATPHTAALCR
jgi:capsid portal protein